MVTARCSPISGGRSRPCHTRSWRSGRRRSRPAPARTPRLSPSAVSTASSAGGVGSSFSTGSGGPVPDSGGAGARRESTRARPGPSPSVSTDGEAVAVHSSSMPATPRARAAWRTAGPRVTAWRTRSSPAVKVSTSPSARPRRLAAPGPWRISRPAAAARASRSSRSPPVNRAVKASPAKVVTSPWCRATGARTSANQALRRPVVSSAPARPCSASCRVSTVNPAMSTMSTDASTDTGATRSSPPRARW